MSSSPPVATKVVSSPPKDITRRVLAQKTANLKAKPRHEVARITKSKISSPVLNPAVVLAASESPTPMASQSVQGDSLLLEPLNNDPAALNRKISGLMEQAASQEAESRQKASILESELAKPSPRQRAKQAMVKASHAVKQKLKGGNASSRSGRWDGSNRPYHLGLSFHTDAVDQKALTGTLTRRVAEGVNLSNPKIQSMTGGSNVPRKPLPIYESMKSRIQRSSSLEDPFLDDGDNSGRASSVTDGKNRERKNRALKSAESIDTLNVPEIVVDHIHTPARQSYRPTVPTSSPQFSSAISGLAQHSDTLSFSSSPEATSTPYSKWGLSHMADSQQRQTRGGHQNKDEDSITSSPASRTITDGSQSVKRKSAQPNLRLPGTPVVKKARVSGQRSHDAATKLASGISNLETQDENPESFSPKKIRAKKQRQQQANRRKGLGIFDVGKGKGKEVDGDVFSQGSRSKGSNSKRNSFSRPGSLLLGRGSRVTGKGNFEKLGDDDSMDIDELA